MAIREEYKEQIVNALLEDDYEPIEYFAVFSDEGQVNQLGSRITTTKTRISNNEISYSSTRSGADVINTEEGDIINSVGFYSDETGGDVQISEDLPSLQQGDNVDLSVNFTVVFND